MAVFALQHCVCTHQWEPILMIAYVSERYLPTLDRVAALAVSTELAAMDISVAICAVSAYVCEYQAGVAPGASNFLMHATQGIASLIVIELRVGTDRFPIGIGVAILARSGDRPVRIRDLRLRATHLRIRIAHRLL